MTKITVKNLKACRVASTQGKGFAGITTAFKDSLVFILANGYKKHGKAAEYERYKKIAEQYGHPLIRTT